jgi:hypothetical protein
MVAMATEEQHDGAASRDADVLFLLLFLILFHEFHQAMQGLYPHLLILFIQDHGKVRTRPLLKNVLIT